MQTPLSSPIHCKESFLSSLQDALNSTRCEIIQSEHLPPPTTGVGSQLHFPNELKLRDYQSEGVDWLLDTLQSLDCAILGDEMGLGKTVQTLALIKALKTKSIGGGGPSTYPGDHYIILFEKLAI